MQLLSVLVLTAMSIVYAEGLSSAEKQALSMDKRAQRFHAWGGKRSDSFPTDFYNKDIADFENEQSKDLKSDQFVDKRKFHAWGGKRSPLDDLDSYRPSGRDYESDIKRMFHAWGGKRSAVSKPIQDLPNLRQYRLSDMAISDKSGLKHPLGDSMEDSTDFRSQTKRRFQPWGGK